MIPETEIIPRRPSRPAMTEDARTVAGDPGPAPNSDAISASDRADARGWRTCVPSEPRPHGRGHMRG